MSTETNKALIRRIFDEAFNQKKLAIIDEIFSPTFVDLSTPNQLQGPQGVKYYFTTIHTCFPDMQISIEDLLAEGNKVAIRTIWQGTHTGEYESIPPTGKQVMRSMIQIFTIENGKIQEEWNEGVSLQEQILA